MTYTEIQGDLFQHLYREPSNDKLRYTQSNVPVYCHCIANDGRWGAGIAPVFIDKIFKNCTFCIKSYIQCIKSCKNPTLKMVLNIHFYFVIVPGRRKL